MIGLHNRAQIILPGLQPLKNEPRKISEKALQFGGRPTTEKGYIQGLRGGISLIHSSDDTGVLGIGASFSYSM